MRILSFRRDERRNQHEAMNTRSRSRANLAAEAAKDAATPAPTQNKTPSPVDLSQPSKPVTAATKQLKAYVAAPMSHEYEFLGPPGALGISIAVIYFSYFFGLGCDQSGCPSLPLGPFFANGFKRYTSLEGLLSLWDSQAAVVYAAWYGWCVLCWVVIPGQWVEGAVMRNGEKLKYKINGQSTRPCLTH